MREVTMCSSLREDCVSSNGSNFILCKLLQVQNIHCFLSTDHFRVISDQQDLNPSLNI